MAGDDASLGEWYKKSLSAELGYPAKLRKVGGNYEFLKKDSKSGKGRWTAIRPSTTLSYPTTSAAAMAPEIAGTAIGAAVGGAGLNPMLMSLGANVGGAAGAAAGRYAKNKLGNMLYDMNLAYSAPEELIKQGYTPEQIQILQRQKIDETWSAGQNSAMWGMASDMGMWALRGLRYWFKGLQPVNKQIADDLLRDSAIGARLAADINRYADPGKEARFSIPQLAVTERTPGPDSLAGSPGYSTYVPSPAGREGMALQRQATQDPRYGSPMWT